MPNIDEAFAAGSSIRDAALHKLIGAIWFQANAKPTWPRSWSAQKGGDKSNMEGT
jgi:hypothetical protein